MKKVFLTIILIVSVVACTMSPMVTTAQVDPHINDKTIATAKIKLGDKASDTYIVEFLSNDDNDDDIEKIALVSYEKLNYKKQMGSKSVPVVSVTSKTHYIDSLLVHDLKRDNGSVERHYGITGSCMTRKSQRKKDDDSLLNSSQTYEKHDVFYIDKKIFDYLSQYFPKELIVKKEIPVGDSKKIDSKDLYDEFDFLY